MGSRCSKDDCMTNDATAIHCNTSLQVYTSCTLLRVKCKRILPANKMVACKFPLADILLSVTLTDLPLPCSRYFHSTEPVLARLQLHGDCIDLFESILLMLNKYKQI